MSSLFSLCGGLALFGCVRFYYSRIESKACWPYHSDAAWALIILCVTTLSYIMGGLALLAHRLGYNPYLPIAFLAFGAGWYVIVNFRAIFHDYMTSGKILLVVAYLLSFSALIAQMDIIPKSGWDVLNFWGPFLVDIVRDVQESCGIFVCDEPYSYLSTSRYGEKHLGLTLYLNLILGSGTSLAMPSVVHSLMVVIVFLLYKHSLSSIGAAIIAIAFFTMPLLENHMLLVGYSEIGLSQVLIAAILWMTLALRYKTLGFLAMSLCCLAGAALIRNTGLYLSLGLLLAAACSLMMIGTKRLIPNFSMRVIAMFICGFIICGLAGALLNQTGLLTLGRNTGNYYIIGGGYIYNLTYNDLSAVLWNSFYSVVINTSFSVFWVFFALSILLKKNESPLGVEAMFACLSGALFVLFTIMVQIFTDYGFRYALPFSDTGGTRNLIAPTLVLVVSSGIILQAKDFLLGRRRQLFSGVPR